ncbi:DUF6313 family protein [Streptomyces sp. PKU-EA00015]|uniref:DUF6313 family protein n=1 Tax=Streptomyces sp. PKU-EA00015 TaxID=2748326 RepID=UPI0035C78BA5
MGVAHDADWMLAHQHWKVLVKINLTSREFQSLGSSVLMQRAEEAAIVGFTYLFDTHLKCAVCMNIPTEVIEIMLRWLDG